MPQRSSMQRIDPMQSYRSKAIQQDSFSAAIAQVGSDLITQSMNEQRTASRRKYDDMVRSEGNARTDARIATMDARTAENQQYTRNQDAQKFALDEKSINSGIDYKTGLLSQQRREYDNTPNRLAEKEAVQLTADINRKKAGLTARGAKGDSQAYKQLKDRATIAQKQNTEIQKKADEGRELTKLDRESFNRNAAIINRFMGGEQQATQQGKPTRAQAYKNLKAKNVSEPEIKKLLAEMYPDTNKADYINPKGLQITNQEKAEVMRRIGSGKSISKAEMEKAVQALRIEKYMIDNAAPQQPAAPGLLNLPGMKRLKDY